MTIYSVVIVDDHTLLSHAIGEMVNNFQKFKVLYTCKNGQELVDKFSESPKFVPDIVLMDINMPIMNGIETTEWVTKNHPSVSVMGLSVDDVDETIIKMLKAGAVGYLLKDSDKSVLENGLLEIVKNGYFHTKNITNLLLRFSYGGEEIKKIKLSNKQTEFIQLACSELTYKEIAEEMCVSPKTVDGYRDVVFSKIGVKNRIGLVMYAIKNKIYTL
jgi:DNA-binding NarL/FixJ family response regulator